MSTKSDEVARIMALIARYRSAGYERFPLHGKKPVHRGWREQDFSSSDPAPWLEQWDNIGIRVADRLRACTEPGPPSFIHSSGNGVKAPWRLSGVANSPPENSADVSRINEGLVPDASESRSIFKELR
jgi:hypothetical protein